MKRPLGGRAASRAATSASASERRVGEHVGGVGEQRQRAGDQARDDLRDHEREDQRERRGQPLAVRVGRDRVVVVLMGVVCVGV